MLPLEMTLDGEAGGIWQVEGKRKWGERLSKRTSQVLVLAKAKGHEAAVRELQAIQPGQNPGPTWAES